MANRKPTEIDIRLEKIKQSFGLVRWLSVCGLAAYFAYLIQDAFVTIATSPLPPAWVQVATLAVNTIGSLSGPSILIVFTYRKYAPSIRARLARVATYEKVFDPHRTSSMPNKDETAENSSAGNTEPKA
ncbi:hypothetical protein EP7_005615 (plasmid) [Isosphaeraceae bacterium EP7]